MKRLTAFFFILVLTFGHVLADVGFRIGTLNCYLCFKPGVAHSGNIANESPLSPVEYQSKIENLAKLMSGVDVVALQEVGGRAEIEDLAKATGCSWVFAKGKDTYTGEEVGVVYRLPGWKVVSNGRVPALDGLLSKHLLVTAERGSERVRILVVHLIRPLKAGVEKHQKQIEAVGAWLQSMQASEPNTTFIVLGDTNDTHSRRGGSLFGVGVEAGELIDFQATHIGGRCFDRIVLAGPGKFANVSINVPPYGKKPNDSLKRVWTDHFMLSADIVLK